MGNYPPFLKIQRIICRNNLGSNENISLSEIGLLAFLHPCVTTPLHKVGPFAGIWGYLAQGLALE